MEIYNFIYMQSVGKTADTTIHEPFVLFSWENNVLEMTDVNA